MKKDKLPIDNLTRKEKEAKKQKAAELKQVAKKGTGLKAGGNCRSKFFFKIISFREQVPLLTLAAASQGAAEAEQTMEDILKQSEHFNPREMGEVVEKFGAGEEILVCVAMERRMPNINTLRLAG